MRRGDRSHVRAWLVHFALAVPLLVWLTAICHIHLVAYAFAFVYPALGLTLLRSFTEHRPASEREHASAIVEAGPLVSLLFLNNNLHWVHHAFPRLPWFELPGHYRARRSEILLRSDWFFFSGYADVLRRYALRMKDHPVHPDYSEVPPPVSVPAVPRSPISEAA